MAFIEQTFTETHSYGDSPCLSQDSLLISFFNEKNREPNVRQIYKQENFQASNSTKSFPIWRTFYIHKILPQSQNKESIIYKSINYNTKQDVYKY